MTAMRKEIDHLNKELSLIDMKNEVQEIFGDLNEELFTMRTSKKNKKRKKQS